jgi:glycogen debranching enzyme GlgX
MRGQSSGSPFPLGASFRENGWWNFAVYSPYGLTSLVIGDYETGKDRELFSLDPDINRTGDIWHISIEAHEDTLLWGWGMDPRITAQARSISPIVADPFARLLKTGNHWGKNAWHTMANDEGELICVATTDDTFSWGSSTHTPLNPDHLIIYETHVRGFTQDPSSQAENPGSYLAMIDKLAHLKELGFTAIELLPIFEFDESEWKLRNPINGEQLYNYWGYSPISFFSPMQRYGTTHDPKKTSRELKTLIQACHDQGIAVILDVVYNHTGEGNEHGPAYSLKLLANSTYYIMNDDDTFANFSGCGNTLNANHPVVIDLVIQSLRHWILEYRIDGFRFDLASVMTRSQQGTPMAEPSLIEAIIKDPLISKTILISEPWDASGLYQTGKLFRLNQCHQPILLEWNDRYRDDVRRFINGAKGYAGSFASRISGSEDIYSLYGRPQNSINYIASHDGFSLFDIVCYNAKHNMENGEHNRDGMNENYSWNCGTEGPTEKSEVNRLRDRQVKNFLVALFMSQGSIMMLMGDEYKRSKRGNNNTWCQDSPLSWCNWNEVFEHKELSTLISTLIALRKESRCFHQNRFLTGEDVQWHGTSLHIPRWDQENQVVACSLKDDDHEVRLFLGFNASPIEQHVEIPPLEGRTWHCVVNTSKHPPEDIFQLHRGPRVLAHAIKMIPHSAIVLYAV